MAAGGFVIFINPGGSGVYAAGSSSAEPKPIGAGPDVPPEQFAEAVATALTSIRYAGEGVVLAIPSGWCLCAPVEVHDLPAKGRRQAMMYRLEEKLPVSAEDVVADFLPSPDGAAVLGVGVLKHTLAPLVAALESRGVAIEAISPSSLLTLQHLLSGPAAAPEARDADALAWSTGDGSLELVSLRGGVPRSWSVLADEPRDLVLHLGLASLDAPRPKKVLAWGLRPSVLEALRGVDGAHVVTGEASQIDAARATVAELLAGRATPWINLRRDDLAVGDRLRLLRTPLSLATAAAVLCVVAVCGAMLWRAHRYDRRSSGYARQQEAVFRQVFPDGPLPPDVLSRLASEERSLRGVSGDSAAPPPAAGLLLALRDLIAALPADVRFRLLELRLEAGRFTIEGQALSHGDADALAAALRGKGGFDVEPPRTEQLPAPAVATADDAPAGGASAVSFTITGSVAPSPPLTTVRRAP